MLSLAARSASAVWNSRQQRPNRTQKRALVQLEPARPAMAAHAFLGDSDQPGTRWSMGLPYAEATGSGGGGRGSSNSGEGGEGGGEGGGTPLPQPAPVSRPKVRIQRENKFGAEACCGSLQGHPALRCKPGLQRTAPCRNMLCSFARLGAESLTGCPPTAPTPDLHTPTPHPFAQSARALSSMGIADLVAVGAALAVPFTWAVRQEALLTALDVKLDTKLDALDNKLDTLGNQMSTMDNNLNTKIAALDAKLTKVDLLLCVLASFATLKLGQRLGLL